MTLGTQAKVWGIALVVFVALLVLLKSILLPFVAGMAIAYLLDPVCDRLERTGSSRTLAILDISFLGDVPQFQRSLAQQDLSLATALGDPSKGTLRQDPNASASQPPPPAPLPSQMNQPAVPGSDPAVPIQPAVPQ